MGRSLQIGSAPEEKQRVALDFFFDENGVDGGFALSFLARRLDLYSAGPDVRGGAPLEELDLHTEKPIFRSPVQRQVPDDISIVKLFEWPVVVRAPGVVALGIQELDSARHIGLEKQHVRANDTCPIRAGHRDAPKFS